MHHLGRGKEQGEKGVTMAKRMLDCVTSDFVTFKKEDWLSSISGSEGRVIACESIGTVLRSHTFSGKEVRITPLDKNALYGIRGSRYSAAQHL